MQKENVTGLFTRAQSALKSDIYNLENPFEQHLIELLKLFRSYGFNVSVFQNQLIILDKAQNTPTRLIRFIGQSVEFRCTYSNSIHVKLTYKNAKDVFGWLLKRGFVKASELCM